MKELILLRGLPGSGKSTFANLLTNNSKASVCDADQYFEKDGEYNFDANFLKQAHEECRLKAEHGMKNSFTKVVVANTFTQLWEMQPYLDLAVQYGYKVTSLIVENRHGNSSIHDVPEATVGNMRNRFEISL